MKTYTYVGMYISESTYNAIKISAESTQDLNEINLMPLFELNDYRKLIKMISFENS